MREALAALNRLAATGAIVQYAIGGAIGAAFYIEALPTENLDAFVFLPSSPSTARQTGRTKISCM